MGSNKNKHDDCAACNDVPMTQLFDDIPRKNPAKYGKHLRGYT